MQTTTPRNITLALSYEEADTLLLALRELYLYDNEYSDEFKDRARTISNNLREAVFEP